MIGSHGQRYHGPQATVGAFLLGYKLNGIRLGLLGGIGALYVSVFGNWVPSIQTLSFVLITTPICFVLGLAFGIWGYLDKKVETALQPVLNVMQTMPQFAYLVPIIALFGLRRSCRFNSNYYYRNSTND